MACAQPFSILNPHYRDIGYYKSYLKYIDVPCGWCLNCRVDKQNWLTDACYYEQKKYDYICAFVTFTYDDIHLLDHSNVSKDNFYTYVDEDNKIHVAPYNSDCPVQYSICRKDCKDFLKRLRSKINYYYDTYKIKNVDLCRKDFKVLYSMEYGDCFGRPHAHFVFFGLDWDFCKPFFEECWKNGFIDSKPVQSGCFEYVTKYLTKQLFGSQAKEKYDDNNLERPFVAHSLGLGKGLILEQYDYILSHNLCYKTINDTLRPIPIYYRNHFFHKRPVMNFNNQRNNMIQAGIKSDMPCFMWKNNLDRFSLKKLNEFRHEQSLLRHVQLERQYENKSIPINPLNEYQFVSFDSMELVRHAENAFYGDVVPF